MRRYQIYSIDEHGGISGDRTIEAGDDNEAVFTVRSMQRPLETQVWFGDRRIARIAGHRASRG